jgi:predicted kinase
MNQVHFIFGAQGAGKSTYARKLAAETGAVIFSIDEWMGALFAADMPQPPDLGWILGRVSRCERMIWATARQVALCGGNVVLDLGFMKAAGRSAFLELAQADKLSVQIHFVDADTALRRQRVLQRNADKGATFSFEVTPAMFNFMEGQFERPTEAELEGAIWVDTGVLQ